MRRYDLRLRNRQHWRGRSWFQRQELSVESLPNRVFIAGRIVVRRAKSAPQRQK